MNSFGILANHPLILKKEINMPPFTIPKMQQDHSIPTWLLHYRPDSDFVENLNSIIHRSAFYLGAGSDFEVSNLFSCSQWIYSSWWSGFDPACPGLTDPDYDCIVNQAILPLENYQGEGSYDRFLNDCVRLFVGFGAIDPPELFNRYPRFLEDYEFTQDLIGSVEHFVNFQVYERRNNSPLDKPLRKCILYVCGLESIFLYKLLYIHNPNRSRRCKLFLKKRGLGVGIGGQPQHRVFGDHDEMRRLLTEALSQSKPDYFVNSSAHTDNPEGLDNFDHHLDDHFLEDYYDLRERQRFGIGPYDPVDLFLYQKIRGRW